MSKAVMTIHGFLTDINDFGVLYNHLEPQYDEIVKCTIPGHDGEVVDFKLFNKDDTLKNVFDTFDELKSRHDSVDVIGFSMGGALASMLACVKDINRVVLVSPSNKYINMRAALRILRFYVVEFNEGLREGEGKLADKLKHADDQMKDYKENSKLSLDMAFKRILPNISFHTYRVFRDLMIFCNKTLEDKISVEAPTLMLWGKLDELVPYSSIAHLEKHFSNHTVKTYEDIGHAMLMTSRGEDLSLDILEFLTSPLEQLEEVLTNEIM